MSQRFEWLTRDYPLKAFSLALALALYFFVSVENDRSVDVDFPIEYRTADDIELIGEHPTAINVTIAGPWASVRSYDPEKLAPVRIDLRDAGPGPVRRRLDVSDVNAPGGMTVVAMTPTQIDVTLDRKVEKQLPVSVDLGIDKPAYGFEVVAATSNPEKVRVIGPATVMQGIDTVPTRPLNLAGREEGFSEEIELRPLPLPLRLRDKVVAVDIDIREETATRLLPVTVRCRDLPAGTELVLEPEVIKVEVRGPRRLIDDFDKQSLVAYLDIANELDEGVRDFEKNVSVEGLPERIGLAGSLPSVRVKVTKLGGRRRGKG
jgi:YbbR domain-containing protein